MSSTAGAEDTPLLRQYKSLKAAYPQAILFFRLGDFYEMFGEDAKIASPILNVVLTKRQEIPMCGVPYHSATQYIAKLLKAGCKIAIAEQLEDPGQAKGLVRRAVTRLITPGTVVEEELLQACKTNYLVALALDTVGWGLACVEVSTGEFWATQALNDAQEQQLQSILAKLDPAEVLLDPKTVEEPCLHRIFNSKTVISAFKPSLSGDNMPQTWDKSLWQNRSLALKAALKAWQYVADTHPQLKEILLPSYRESWNTLQLDGVAIRTLELVASAEGEKKFSLWGVLDKTLTPMGSRKLKHWILHPLMDVPEIEKRLHCVEELMDKAEPRDKLANLLGKIADIERISHRLATRSASPRDLAALRDSLLQGQALSQWLGDCHFYSAIASWASALEDIAAPLKALQAKLRHALMDHPPARVSDGGLIREGFHAGLDEFRRIKRDSRHVLQELENRERLATGIGSLKIGYTSVFGFYIEITKTHQAKVPAHYTRKQTLANAERYIIPELKELELKILGCEERALRLEAELFESLRQETLTQGKPIRRLASLIAELDALRALAEAALAYGYVKPKVDLSYDFEVEEGRHPAVEMALPAGSFVPNSLGLNDMDCRILIVTGPNMGGKSVFLRQNALMVIMAQMGGFVPAKSARIGLVDKILARIGSRDQLAQGESTFMVEMRETSYILKNATPRSLILLDEVGRGTSTYDGISIAWAVIEYLTQLRANSSPRVIFATHYFELTELAKLLPGVRNANVEAREWTTPAGRTEVVFLHKVSPGPADRSFGIHVAQLAGLPASCLARAKEILQNLENKSAAKSAQQAPSREPVLPLFEEHPILREIQLSNPNDLTPLQALKKISEWKNRL